MANYYSPGVYLEDKPTTPVIEGASTSIGGFVGITQRGTLNKPILITSWNAFITEFAFGMDSPFLSNSTLAYSVYGFFQNGGKSCYVIRVAHSTADVATGGFSDIETDPPVVKANSEGAWGNSISVTISTNADEESLFDFTVRYGSVVVEKFIGLSNDITSKQYWVDYVTSHSQYVTATGGSLSNIENAIFSGGVDGVVDIVDTDYSEALALFDTVADVNMIAIPGQTSTTLNSALMTYCENRADVFGIIDAPESSTATSIKTLRKNMSCKNACLVWPWIKVADPLSPNGVLRTVPCAGHVMGVYARIISNRGVWKAPAGTEATIRGAIDTAVALTNTDLDSLNPAGIISIVPRAGYGMVIWGARSLNPDSSMKYVSDVLLDIYIKKSVKENTQSFVFEPNNESTWMNIRTSVETFLDTLWRDGGLYGESSEEAYYVKCDADLNTEAIRGQGKLICEVGYAGNKPAEFIVFQFSQNVSES